MITIRRVPSLEHNFQLVVTKVYDEGDQELLEDEDESEIQPYPPFPSIQRILSYQPTRSARSSLVKSSSFGQVLLMMNLHSFGATSMAMSTSFSSSLPPARMSRLELSSKRACTVQCTKGNTGKVQTRPRILTWKNLFGSAFLPYSMFR